MNKKAKGDSVIAIEKYQKEAEKYAFVAEKKENL